MAISLSVQYNGGLLPDIILLTQRYYHGATRLNVMKMFLKKNQSTPRPSEHPPVMGGENVKTFRWDQRLQNKYKTSSWHLNRFLDADDIGSTVQCRGEAHRYTVHLH